MYTRITGISIVVNVDNRTFLNNTIENKSKLMLYSRNANDKQNKLKLIYSAKLYRLH